MVENRFGEPDLTAAVEKNIGPYRLAVVSSENLICGFDEFGAAKP